MTGPLREHPAYTAWSRLCPRSVQPNSIETLRQKNKSAVYRLHGIGPEGAVIAKQCRPTTGRVERMVYEELLPRVPAPALRFYGFLEEPGGEFCWLFLEDGGSGAYSADAPQHRALAGRWLAEAHLASLPAGLTARLPARDLGHYLQLLRGARATLLGHVAHNAALSSGDAEVLRAVAGHCDALESRWTRMESVCNAMPRTLVHDDFVIKNLRIGNGASSPALWVFDWELAGWGLPGTDLAQSGSYVASPDLVVYTSILRREHPHLTLRDVQRVAVCGRLLRWLDEVHWAVSELEFGSEMFLLKPVPTLRKYAAALGVALSAWSRS